MIAARGLFLLEDIVPRYILGCATRAAQGWRLKQARQRTELLERAERGATASGIVDGVELRFDTSYANRVRPERLQWKRMEP